MADLQGIKKLRKIQLGRETTAGTEVNASTLWRGTGTLEDLQETKFIDEDIGYICGVDRVSIPKVGASLELDETPATFEQVLHLLEMGIATATPSTAGGGNAYTYTAPTTSQPYLTASASQNPVKSYTVECGDNYAEEQFLFGFCPEFKLSGKVNEEVMMGGKILGRQVAPGTYTTSISVPSVEHILMNKSTIYLDAVTGGLGGTVKANTLLGFDLAWKTGWVPVQTGEGVLYYTFIKNAGEPTMDITCKVTFEHEVTSVAEKVFWRAGTSRLLQLKFVGATLTTTGTTYTTKTLLINLTGPWEKFDKLGEKDGNDVLEGTIRARYNATDTTFASIIDVCDLASVP
jgi:hypothetical protein